MKSKAIAVCLLCAFALAQTNEEQYLSTKKQELENQIREFDEAKQALEAYRASFEALQKEKLEDLAKKQADLNATLEKIEQTKQENERILRQSEANLQSINEKTQGRIKEIYSQMKDGAIADVLSQMDAEEASKIILSLEPRKISGVLSKMQPAKASELTLLIKNLDTKDANATQD